MSPAEPPPHCLDRDPGARLTATRRVASASIRHPSISFHCGEATVGGLGDVPKVL